MDWKSAIASFMLIFLMEIGDKTQLMLITMSARSKAPHMIFFGAAAAFILSTALAVIVGETVLRAVPIKTIRASTGVAFVGIGAMLLWRSLR